MKPLYLLAGALHVTLDDGPALVVCGHARAAQRFPLQRVSRVLCGPEVSFTTPALLACADAGMVVTFMDAHGALRACVTGHSGRRRRLAARMREFLDRPDWADRLADWLTAVDAQARRRFLRRMDQPGDAVPAARLRAMLDARLDALLAPALRDHVRGRWQAWAQAVAAQALSEAGVTGADAVWLEDTLGLRALLADRLWWRAAPPLVQALEELGAPPLRHLDSGWLVQQFEHNAAALERYAMALLLHLRAWLAELAP